MATLVGGAFLSATVQTLVEKLASKELRDYIRNTKLNESLLRELGTTLLTLQVVLDDAEEKQISKPAVKQWLDQLKDAIFDAEDLLDQISTDSLRCKVENTEAENITSQVWNLLSSTFKNSYREINSQMKDMCQRLQLFSQQINILGLQTISGRVSRRTPTTSIVNQSLMVGRKDDQEKLTNMLLSDNGTSNNNNNIGVVTILGMGGVGKTTLAQLLYNNKEVQEHFDLRAWTCVSEDFDILRVTKTLLESVTLRGASRTDNLELLRVELKQNLRDKRFLLVMDDLWNVKYNDWDHLLTFLLDGKVGSKVIVTTRQEKDAEVVTGTFPIHKLEPLSVEDCWSLLSKHAFGSEDFHGSKYQHLEAIGKKIAKKCGGLPIAAKTLGGLLHSKVEAKEWTTILNSNIWDLPNDDILPALRLSYQYLPSHLKRCFAYCSIFPKDHSLDKKQLVLLWMAEGFLEDSHGEKAAEEVGDDYFVELLSRSLIQQADGDASGKKFVMHDLVNDLATIVSGKSCYRLECGEVSEDVRHLSYKREKYDISKKFSYKFKCLRTFLSLGHISSNFLSRKVVDDLLPTLGRLRVLSLSKYASITVLPNSVGNLLQLRYLDLSYTKIKGLPDTMCNLYNLQTLILLGCYSLTELPSHIGKLINLRHLDISWTEIRELPMQIVGLKDLRTLTIFVVGKKREDGLSVRELRKFPHLQGKLSILNLHNVIDPMEASDANLKNKQIEELELEWGKQTEDTQKEKAVIDELKPSANLKHLTIKSYGGTSFPSWLGDSSFSNMVSLCIYDCEYCISLPPLGQLPCLKDLTVIGMTLLDTIGQEFYYVMEVGGSISPFQPFPSLEYLKFEEMPNWKEWLPFENGELPFPRLKTLILDGCPELRGHLPSHLSSIEELQISDCDHLLATPPTLHWLSSIKKIYINLRVPKSSTKRTQWSLLESDTPCLLQEVEVGHCASLPKMIVSSSCLRLLVLRDCPSLTAFPEDGLPTSLQTLTIYGCEKLAFLPPETWRNYTMLRDLTIVDSCDAPTSFPLDGFPVLESLEIRGCSSLESICISENSSLLPSTLQTLWVFDCKALRSLPQQMDSLTKLSLFRLPELEFPPFFTLPPKLRSFGIDSPRLPPQGITEWGLQRLTALSYLDIVGDDIVNAMLEGRLLPISLVELRIWNLSHTKSLEGNGLRHLSYLETLGFFSCPMLESLPEDQLPSSLKILCIRDCPLLEERYESQKGEHWSKIAHIPVLKTNGNVTI